MVNGGVPRTRRDPMASDVWRQHSPLTQSTFRICLTAPLNGSPPTVTIATLEHNLRFGSSAPPDRFLCTSTVARRPRTTSSKAIMDPDLRASFVRQLTLEENEAGDGRRPSVSSSSSSKLSSRRQKFNRGREEASVLVSVYAVQHGTLADHTLASIIVTDFQFESTGRSRIVNAAINYTFWASLPRHLDEARARLSAPVPTIAPYYAVEEYRIGPTVPPLSVLTFPGYYTGEGYNRTRSSTQEYRTGPSASPPSAPTSSHYAYQEEYRTGPNTSPPEPPTSSHYAYQGEYRSGPNAPPLEAPTSSHYAYQGEYRTGSSTLTPRPGVQRYDSEHEFRLRPGVDPRVQPTRPRFGGDEENRRTLSVSPPLSPSLRSDEEEDDDDDDDDDDDSDESGPPQVWVKQLAPPGYDTEQSLKSVVESVASAGLPVINTGRLAANRSPSTMNVGSQVINVSGTISYKTTSEKVVKLDSAIRDQSAAAGTIRSRYKDKDTARWLLTENENERVGVQKFLRTAVIVQRQHNEKFEASIEVSITLDGPSKKRKALASLANSTMSFFPDGHRSDFKRAEKSGLTNLDQMYWAKAVILTHDAPGFRDGKEVGESIQMTMK